MRRMSSRAGGRSHQQTTPPNQVNAQVVRRRRSRPLNEAALALSEEDSHAEVRVAQPFVPATIQPGSLGARAVAKSRLTLAFLWVAVFLIAADITFMLAYFHDHRSIGGGTQARAVQLPQARSTPIEMRAEPQGDTILLSWNRNSPALQSATDGVLKIDDGPQHRQMALDHAELATGLILYKPVSSDVVFRLEIREKEGQRAVESVEAVGTPASAASDEPKTEPNAPETGKNSSPLAIPTQHGLTEQNPARAGSQSVRRLSQKLTSAALPAQRSSERQFDAGQKPPSLPIGSVSGPQPFVFSQETLPKPPSEPSARAVQGTDRAAAPPPDTAASPIKPLPVVRESISRNAAQSMSAYVPARPIKWAAPDAKSLGVSRISAPTDVAVKVRIDESGRVAAAHALLDGSEHDESVRAAVAAAVKQWIFEPAKMQGKNVPSEDTIVIHLDPKR